MEGLEIKAMLVDLAQNAAILLAFSMVYDSLWLKGKLNERTPHKILTGAIIGIIGIVVMATPWKLSPGIMFDTRSVLLSISGMFFGAIPTVIAMIVTAAYRLQQGGDGAYMGIAVIVSSSLIGLLWRKLRPDWNTKWYLYELLAMGGLVHAIMLLCVFLLPSDKVFFTLNSILSPIFMVYMPATLIIGIIMARQQQYFMESKARNYFSETERRYYEILNSSNLLSVLLNSKGQITYCNDHLCEVTGYSREYLIGKDWLLLLPADQQTVVNKIYRNIISGVENHKAYQNEIVCSDGTHLYISWHNSLLKDSSGEIVGTASVGFDFTKQKEVERELQSHKEKLEQQVQMRTRELLDKNRELQDFNKLFINREFRIKELKGRVKYLEESLRATKQN